MKKRLLSILMALALCLTLLPTVALAEEAYHLWVGGTQVTSTNKDDVLEDGTVILLFPVAAPHFSGKIESERHKEARTMKVVIRGEDYSVRQYELNAGETVLAFTGVRDSFSFPYEDVKDIVITQDARGKYFFTMICAGKLYEGQITQPQGIESFARTLSKKLGGVIQLEVKKG